MASELSSLLQHGWENLWKNRVLWWFSALILIGPVFYLIVPIQNNVDLVSSLLNLLVSVASIYFTFLSFVGVSFVAYCIAIGNPIDFQTALQASKKLFWRLVRLSLLLLLLIAPFVCTVAYFFWRFLEIKDVRQDFFLASIPLSIFTAMGYFPITEVIRNNSKIGESLKTAWAVFTDNFLNLAIIGVLLICVFHVMNVSMSVAIILVQNSFDFSTLSNLDFTSPQLAFPDNSLYELITSISQAMWEAYSTSIFTFAYLKYSSAKMGQHMTA